MTITSVSVAMICAGAAPPPREVPERLRNGLMTAGTPTENTSVVPIEEDAANAALDMAQPGDIIALLYMDHDKIWELLRAPQ